MPGTAVLRGPICRPVQGPLSELESLTICPLNRIFSKVNGDFHIIDDSKEV